MRGAGASGGVGGRVGRAERGGVMGTRCRVRGAGGFDVETTGRRASAAVPWRLAAVAALLSLAAPLPASAAGRVALVVGNGAYTHAGRLPNPVNDASDVAAALGRLGFEVTVVRDAGRTALNEALRAFTRRSAGADMALVFYAGHAMEMDGTNYLLPVDARIEQDTDVRYETVTLGDVLASTSGAGLRVVILDACRNNPLARSMQRTVSTRSVSNGSLGDLNEDLLGDETLVAYSAAAGTTAADGDGRNSPYTAALLAHLEEPVEIGLLFRRVRERVLTATSGRQRPHEYQSLLREHYLSGGAAAGGGPAVPAGAAAAGGPAAADPAAAVAGGSTAVLAQQETVFWQSIVASTNRADFESYLARWPAGVYAPLARRRVAALRAAADPPRSDLPSEAVSDALPPGRGDGAMFRDCPDCPEMAVIPAGEFWMGSPAAEEGRSDHEGPRRRVALRSFALGVREVTFDEWEACVRDGGCNGHRLDGRGLGAYPVVDVSWEDARAYAAWLSRKTGEPYRLPSEAEWEYAARGGTTTSRYWGDSSSPQCGHANGADAAAKRVYSDWTTAAACDDGAERAAPAGSYSANAFGLFDVLGNVWEWTEDCWAENHRGAPADGSPRRGGDCGRRALRGGSWFNASRDLRSAARVWTPADLRRSFAGFRVARTLDRQSAP